MSCSRIGESGRELLARWNTDSKQTAPTTNHLRIEHVEDEDENTLHGSEDGEENEKDIGDDREWEQKHQISEDPGETNGNKDRKIDSEFLLFLAQTLSVGLWSS